MKENNSDKHKYDLEERTACFAEEIIELCKSIPENTITKSIIIQLIKAGTSVGANYHEADCAESRKDFEHKIGICKKESKESRYWLRIIAKASPQCKAEAERLEKEACELNLIFTAIIKSSKDNSLKIGN